MKKCVLIHLFSAVFISPALLAFMTPNSIPSAEVSDIPTQPQDGNSSAPTAKTVPAADKATDPSNPLNQPVDLYPQFGGVELKQGADLFVTGEFLYWTILKNARGSSLKNLTAGKSLRKETFYDFDYRPGFRVGIGTVLPSYDQWFIAGEYTWYHHGFTTTDKALGVQSLNPQTVTITQFLPSFFRGFQEIQTKNNFFFDEGKLKVGRPFYLGPRVIAKPYFGVKGVWTRIKMNQTLTPFPDQQFGTVLQQADYRMWSVGSMGGFNGNFLLFGGLSIVAKAEVGFLYGRLSKRTDSIIGPLSPISLQSSPKAPDVVYPMAEGGIGFEWSSYLANQKSHLNMGISYDFTSLFVAGSSSSVLIISSGSFLHGITINSQLDF